MVVLHFQFIGVFEITPIQAEIALCGSRGSKPAMALVRKLMKDTLNREAICDVVGKVMENMTVIHKCDKILY